MVKTQHTEELINRLRLNLEGDVLDDLTSRMLYATDASLYQILPLAVVRPRNIADCKTLITLAREYRIPLIPRAAGTSLAGQVVGEGLVVDTSRYLNRIMHIDVTEQTVTVEAGVVLSQLNAYVRPHGLMFAPDPSTSNRCTVSGVIGNNAWGAHALKYGTTRDNVLSADLMLANGDLLTMGPLSRHQLDGKMASADSEGNLYREIIGIIGPAIKNILLRYPARSSVPCNTGYAVRDLAESQYWQTTGLPFSLLPLLCGSEGTLGLITTATLRLVPIPRYRAVICLHAAHLAEALAAVPQVVAAGAAAVELLDNHILHLAQQNLLQKKHRHWLEGNPAAVLLIEFCGDDEAQVHHSIQQTRSELIKHNLGYAWPVFDGPLLEEAWDLRRAGLGLLMGSRAPAKPFTFIEDSAVPIDRLGRFVAEVQALMAQHNVECVYYGSVGMGLIHLRPLLDLNLPAHRNLLPVIADSIAALLGTHNGCMSAKHGDGRVRSGYIPALLGEEIYRVITDIKNLFDPQGLFNPHKIVAPKPLTEQWRAVVRSADETMSHKGFKWNGESLAEAAGHCQGAGACRKGAGEGVMCPSYMATGEEKHTTRGRANVYRQVLQHKGLNNGLIDQSLHEVLDLCLSCKGCKAECPANVDMAKLKAEHLHHYYKHYGVPVRARFLTRFAELARLGSHFPKIANRLTAARWFKNVLNLHENRTLPQLAGESLHAWYKKQPSINGQKLAVIYTDAFTTYYEVNIGIAAISILQRLGYEVKLSPCFGSLRTAISQGRLDIARRRLQKISEWLTPYAKAGTPIIGLEPSEVLTFRDEASSLAEGDKLRERVTVIAKQAMLFEEFLLHDPDITTKLRRPPQFKEIWLHGHCHQKVLCDVDAITVGLQNIFSCKVKNMSTGCCGMAGAFGYEKEHYATSMAIGNLVLLPALLNSPMDIAIIAVGTSCREQIRHGAGKKAFHPAELIWQQLNA